MKKQNCDKDKKGTVTLNFDYKRNSIKHSTVLYYLVYVFLNVTDFFD